MVASNFPRTTPSRHGTLFRRTLLIFKWNLALQIVRSNSFRIYPMPFQFIHVLWTYNFIVFSCIIFYSSQLCPETLVHCTELHQRLRHCKKLFDTKRYCDMKLFIIRTYHVCCDFKSLLTDSTSIKN